MKIFGIDQIRDKSTNAIFLKFFREFQILTQPINTPHTFLILGLTPRIKFITIKTKIMVKVIDFKTHSNEQGKEFNVLIVPARSL